MKTLLFSLAMAIALVGLLAYLVHRNPDASRISEALDNLNPESGIPKDAKAPGHLNLKKRHPDGDEGQVEFDRLYSAPLAIERVHQMESFMESFRKLTNLSRAKVPPQVLLKVGNTGGEMQDIGFHNIPLIIEGTILKQDYQLRQVEYKLAQLQSLGGDISSKELEQKRAAYIEATRNFQEFWDSKLPTE
jgi:hypothetical protein